MASKVQRAAGFAAAALAGVAASLIAANPASAHTGISIEPARAGAKNAVASVNAEAESETAGVTKVQIFLPVGIAPDDITQVSLPKRWTLTKQDSGYTVEGPAMPVGRNAEHKIRIRQLPTYASISFKVLQTYSDGRIDRWIALPDEGADLKNPAPTVKLAGGSGVAPTVTPAPSPTSSTSPSGEVAASPATSPSNAGPVAAPERAADESSTGSSVWWIIGGVVLVLLAAGAFLVVRRRPSTPKT